MLRRRQDQKQQSTSYPTEKRSQQTMNGPITTQHTSCTGSKTPQRIHIKSSVVSLRSVGTCGTAAGANWIQGKSTCIKGDGTRTSAHLQRAFEGQSYPVSSEVRSYMLTARRQEANAPSYSVKRRI